MQTVPPPLAACPACGTPMDPAGACPRCAASVDAQEQTEAIDFALRRLEGWYKDGQLTEQQYQALSAAYTRERQLAADAMQTGRPITPTANLPPRDRCWSCKEPIVGDLSHCAACGAPAVGPAVKSLRYYRFLAQELDRLEAAGTITLRQAHELGGEPQERITALKRKLEKDRALMVQ